MSPRSPRSRPAMRVALALLAMLAAGGCDRDDGGPADVSVIGPAALLADPARTPPSAPAAVLLGTIAQGLVRFDANGQIEPALAERWIVSEDGTSYIFRLADLHWTDGTAVTSEAVARRLRTAIAHTSSNPDRGLFEVVDEIAVMTDRVIEIRLKTPRPNLLQLLAQPEMALLSGRDGTGPMRIERDTAGTLLLAPIADADPDTPPPTAWEKVRLRGEPAARAIARFRRGDADLVLGGTFATLMYAQVADVPARQLRVDPVPGLFGIIALNRDGLLGEHDARMGLTMALDRGDLLGRYAVRGWGPMLSITPEQLDSATPPMQPTWSALDLGERRRIAATRIAAWRADKPRPQLRLALPAGPGARLLFAWLRASWHGVGVDLVAVAEGEAADLAVIDSVAPMDSVSWYLDRISCARGYACDPDAEAKRLLGRGAHSLDDRARLLAEAEVAASEAAWFIPLARPLRWSLVSPRLSEYRENARAAHPLTALRPAHR
ncbi:peptide/nickel transport system substrate-binding protein [Sphingomonas zeicaulis]|uniref:ABC transporter substrate-binding protein n=1 Tax=Sphingomonas zeicaulis TaxID=1632740 RepID=UPI003D23CCE7